MSKISREKREQKQCKLRNCNIVCKYVENWKKKHMDAFDTKYLTMMQKSNALMQRDLRHTKDYYMCYGDNLQKILENRLKVYPLPLIQSKKWV